MEFLHNVRFVGVATEFHEKVTNHRHLVGVTQHRNIGGVNDLGLVVQGSSRRTTYTTIVNNSSNVAPQY